MENPVCTASLFEYFDNMLNILFVFCSFFILLGTHEYCCKLNFRHVCDCYPIIYFIEHEINTKYLK